MFIVMPNTNIFAQRNGTDKQMLQIDLGAE